MKSALESPGSFESVLNPLSRLRSKTSVVCNVSDELWVSCVKLALDESDVSQERLQRSEVRSNFVLAKLGLEKMGFLPFEKYGQNLDLCIKNMVGAEHLGAGVFFNNRK